MDRDSTTVYIIDDDASVGRALARLMRSAGFVPEVFETIEKFIASEPCAAHVCIIADAQLYGDGLSMQRFIKKKNLSMPVILLSADDADDLGADAWRGGISAFFRKPVDGQVLIDAIEWGLNQGRK